MNVVFEGRWKRNPEKNERKGEKIIKRTRSKFLAYSPFTATINILVKFMFTFLIFCLFFIDLILVRDIPRITLFVFEFKNSSFLQGT